jgi:hypothetical protein
MTVYNEELISGLDDLLYDVTITDPVTGAPITQGIVQVKLCTVGTTTALGPNSTVTLTHQGAGRWTGQHEAFYFSQDLPAIGGLFDKVLIVAASADRLLARCRRVSILDDRILRDTKRYLRLQTDEENVLLLGLINAATAMVEAWLGRPIEARSMTFTDSGFDVLGKYMTSLRIPVTPIGSLTSVTDVDGTAIPTTDLRLDATTGIIVRKDGSSFVNGPYTMVAVVGLSASQQYTLGGSAAIQQAVLDIVADLYQRRNPVAGREAEGGGIAVDYADMKRGVGADNAREDLLPSRLTAILAPFRMLGVP